MVEGVRKPAQRGKPRRFCTAVVPGDLSLKVVLSLKMEG